MLVILSVLFVALLATAQEQSLSVSASPAQPSLPFLDLFSGASNLYSEPIRKTYSDPEHYISCPKTDGLSSFANVLGSAAKIMLSAAIIAVLKLLAGKLLLFPLLFVILVKMGLKAFLLWPMISKMMKYFKKKKKKGHKSRMITDCSQRIACVIQRASRSGLGSNIGAAAAFTLIDDIEEDSSFAKTAMDHTYPRLTVLLCLLVIRLTFCYPEEQIMSYPQYRTINNYPMVNSQFQPMFRNPPMQPKQILYTKSIRSEPPQTTPEAPPDGLREDGKGEVTFADFVDALNEISQDKKDQFRDVEHDNNPTYSSPHPIPYGYPTRSGYGSLLPESPFPLSPVVHPPESKAATLTPGLGDLVKPLSKVAGKGVSSLFTGIAPGLEMNGLKDVFINGVIKPFLAAKTSLKALIAKLVVPVIALVLINVEVLLVVWWLWEDCSKEAKLAEPPYPSPQPAYNSTNNSYR